MSTSNTPPDPGKAVAELNRRVDILERRLRNLEGQFKPEITFSYSGALTASSSPVWTRRETGRLMSIAAHLGTAGTTATAINVLVNGVVVATATIPATVASVVIPCSVVVHADVDRLQDIIATVGSGAQDLTVQHRFAAAGS